MRALLAIDIETEVERERGVGVGGQTDRKTKRQGDKKRQTIGEQSASVAIGMAEDG